ncbi:GDSL-type esterase/lipase family protein [Azonexus sp. R2A61]|uniref:GDSL-type esterase/lipase family protein n=1 Tax=Azonexus sp. R2A61 TaxID=2744443 RepID=UPI001F399470|nr:GDSL-type esterase/lipase family protein [Azonexus sp. R2A61]
MQRRAFLATLAGSGLAALLAGCNRKPPRLAALPADSVVLAFGDSVTFGTGAAAGEDWPGLLAARTGWRIVNAGVPGDTAQAAVGRIGPLLAEHRPQLVLLELGGNDFLRRRPAEAVKEDLRRIVREIRANGTQVVLIAVPALSLMAMAGRPSDAPIYAALADEEGIPLVPDVFADVLGRSEWRADAIHPNAEGYRQMTAGIHARLQQLGLAAR